MDPPEKLVREVRLEWEPTEPDPVVIDPISHLSVEDQAPAILLVARTRKVRNEETMRGRNLANCVSGSVVWVNTSRWRYLGVPFDADSIEDQRVYFAAANLNEGPNHAPTVWKRRSGTFFQHDPETDPKCWGQVKTKEESAEEKHKIRFEDLKKSFGTR